MIKTEKSNAITQCSYLKSQHRIRDLGFEKQSRSIAIGVSVTKHNSKYISRQADKDKQPTSTAGFCDSGACVFTSWRHLSESQSKNKKKKYEGGKRGKRGNFL